VKGRVFDEFSPMMHRHSTELLFPTTPFGEQKKFDVWGSTYNKLFELFRDDELPKSLRGRRRTTGDGNDVDTNRKRVVSEIQQRNTHFSTQDDRSITLSPSPPVNLIDRAPPNYYRIHRQQEPVYGTVWKGHPRGGSSSLPTRRFDIPKIDLEEIHEGSNYRTKGNGADQPQNRPNGTNSAVNNHNGYRYGANDVQELKYRSADNSPVHNYRSTVHDLPCKNYRSSVTVNDLPETQAEKQRDYYRALNSLRSGGGGREARRDSEGAFSQREYPHMNDTPALAQSPSLQDEVFTNGSPVPLTKKKLVYRIPGEMVTVSALPPNEYDYPPTERSDGRIIDRSNLLRTVSTSSSISSQDSPIRRLLSTHLEGNPKRVQRISTRGAGMPAPAVKTTILRCSNGRKAAIIQVDEIARIIRWIDPSEENGPIDHNVNIQRTASPMGIQIDSSILIPSSIAPYELQLIDIVEEKIDRRIPLDWPELFVLKNAHCRRVIPLEERLRTIRKLKNGEYHEISRMEREILDEYVRYETLIDRVVLCGSPYTRLAHSIMKADAFWFHARAIRDPSERSEMYRKAIDFYAELLERAESACLICFASIISIC
ncbi:hypothetical protein PMAYCL1PPCAC_10824, partial [Pristionchus mayeri]